MKILKKLDQLLNVIQNWILIITGTGVMMMILVNAACRFLRIDWFGSEELTMFVAFWLYFVGSACASREKVHISADMLSLFTENKKIRAISDIIKNLISLGVCSIFTYWCYNYVLWQKGLGAKSPVYKVPVILATIPILLAFGLWVIYLIRDLLESFSDFKNASKNETKEG